MTDGNDTNVEPIPTPNFIGMLIECQEDALAAIADSNKTGEFLRIEFLGAKSDLSKLTRQIRLVPTAARAQVGTVVNDVKKSIIEAINKKGASAINDLRSSFDPTMPGIRPPEGHLHIVTQAIEEITRIFERISFIRVRHPEVDWDWYAFGALNMPANHPARDEWETFFLDVPWLSSSRMRGSALTENKTKTDSRLRGNDMRIVLTPHTSNGQVREMEKKKLPIRMINIAKCYRRQIDVSHTPMFHQFEGLYIDRDVSIAHLKGVLDYFVKQFFGPERKARIRPFHFQFTEPSFEVDISCGVCNGAGCKLCKQGWLELGGAGMVHPAVLKNGRIDTTKYNGFAFGWGVERCFMMKAGTRLDDIRLLYSNDVRFLEQF